MYANQSEKQQVRGTDIIAKSVVITSLGFMNSLSPSFGGNTNLGCGGELKTFVDEFFRARWE